VGAVDQGTTSTSDLAAVGITNQRETTALGAAYAAGPAAGFWRDTAELRANWRESRRWEPAWSADRRAAGYTGWKKAVDRTLDWVDVG
jgi:glycerol kinase